MKFPTMPDLMVAVLQGRRHIRQQRRKSLFAIDERPRHEILAIQVQKIDQEEDEADGVAGIDASWIMLNEVMPSGPRRTVRRRDRPGGRRATIGPWQSRDIYASSRARCA